MNRTKATVQIQQFVVPKIKAQEGSLQAHYRYLRRLANFFCGDHFRGIAFVSVLLVCTLSLPGIAELSATQITWEDVAARIERHPVLIQAKTQILAAQGDVDESKEFPNPEVSVSYGSIKELEAEQRDSAWGIEVSFPLEYAHVMRNRVKAAMHEVEATAQDVAAIERELFRQLRTQYLLIVSDQAVLQTMYESEAQLEKLAESIKLKVEHGEIRPMELTRIENELTLLQLELAKLQAEYQIHRDQLNVWLDNAFSKEFTVEEQLDAISELPAIEKLFQRIDAQHPNIKSAQSRYAQAKVNLQSEKSARLPELSTGIYYENEPDAKNYGVVLSCSLPVFSRNKGGIAKAQAAIAEKEQEMDIIQKQLKESLIMEYAIAQHSRDAISEYVSKVIPKTQKAVAEVETLYQAGEVDLMEVFDSRRSLIQAQKDLIATQIQYHLNLLEITTVAGTLSESSLQLKQDNPQSPQIKNPID